MTGKVFLVNTEVLIEQLLEMTYIQQAAEQFELRVSGMKIQSDTSKKTTD